MQEDVQKTNREKLVDLRDGFLGVMLDGSESDLELIVEILEVLIEKVEALDGHGHTIS